MTPSTASEIARLNELDKKAGYSGEEMVELMLATRAESELSFEYRTMLRLLNDMKGKLETVREVVDEYLHWRKVNPHIKGGDNYLKRLREALALTDINQTMEK